jgi:hypothetical protein
MASLQQKGKSCYCQFLYHGKRHMLTIGPVSESEASAKSQRVVICSSDSARVDKIAPIIQAKFTSRRVVSFVWCGIEAAAVSW